MAKTRTKYVCQNCGVDSPKWIGRCPSCGEWNSYVEEIVTKKATKTSLGLSQSGQNKPLLISNINPEKGERINTQSIELNRVLGGGLVQGSLVLIGGEPGIGKSTLLLQIALKLQSHKILYVSGEESCQQIKLRADRLKSNNPNCYILSETLLENVLLHAQNTPPDILIIDSIQTLYSDKVESTPGSVAQVRECANSLLRYAKDSNIPIILIGHINKEGNIAGPKVLEHIVDTVLRFEGDNNYLYRIVRAIKNRFGSTSEIAIFEMQDTGLREVNNPSELLLSQYDEDLSGVAIAAGIEGLRPFLFEVQALVSTAAYGTPQRSATGFDLRRLNMLLAVLEKKAGFRLVQKDVFLNITGGIKVDDPGIDLAVLCAVLSSDLDIPLNRKICTAAEIGLTGEVRPVSRILQRIDEAKKLGFEEIIVSKFNTKNLDKLPQNIKIHTVSKVEQAFALLFG